MCHNHDTTADWERVPEEESTEESPEDEQELDEDPGELEDDAEPVQPSGDDYSRSWI